jgi:hypothetical protein
MDTELQLTESTSSQSGNQILATTLFEEIALPSGQAIQVPTLNLVFRKWTGQPIRETFGGKPLIDMDGKPMFAELAIMHRFIKSDWQARWIETYGNGAEPKHLSEWKDDKYKNQVPDPISDDVTLKHLKTIAQLNGSYSGCWDVLAWRGGKIVFAESKRFKKDRIRGTQVGWLDAGLRSGLTCENFRIVQWDFK